MSLDEIRARLDAQEAFLKNAQGDPDAALALLAGKRDPESTLRALNILLEHDRIGDAVNWAKDLVLHELWADRLIVALLRANEDVRADKVLEWSRSCSDPSVHDRCALNYARAAFFRTFGA